MPERNEAYEGTLDVQQKIFFASIIDVAVTLHPITKSSTWLDSFICCLTFITGKRLKTALWNGGRKSQVQ